MSDFERRMVDLENADIDRQWAESHRIDEAIAAAMMNRKDAPTSSGWWFYVSAANPLMSGQLCHLLRVDDFDLTRHYLDGSWFGPIDPTGVGKPNKITPHV